MRGFLRSDDNEDKDKLVGVMCKDCIVLSGCQMFAATQLPPWLCSTILFPDVAVYPFDGNNVTSETASIIKHVQRNTIPFFLAEYYSINIRYSAKQLAFKLTILFQLFRSYGYSGSKVSGIVLPSMSKKEKKEKIRMKDIEANLKELAITVESSSTCNNSNVLSKPPQDRQAVKENVTNSISSQNTVILVTVEWNCVSLKLDITYTPLRKENVMKMMNDVLTEQRHFHSQLRALNKPSRMFIELSKEELDKLKHSIVEALQKKHKLEVKKLHLEVKKLCLQQIQEIDEVKLEEYISRNIKISRNFHIGFDPDYESH